MTPQRRLLPPPASSPSVAGLCEAAAAAATGVSLAAIAAPVRCRAQVARARQLAVYLHHVALGASLSSCARLFGRDRATIRHACARIEDLREDARFDEAAARLERAVAAQRDMALALIADPLRAQHGEVTRRTLEKGAPPVLVNDAESPLAWLARRRGADGKAFLAPAQIEAGERFRRDIERAQLLQRVTANWDASAAATRNSSDRNLIVSDIALDAREQLSRACDAVGPDLFGLLADVCGYLKGLETIESERGWPARSSEVVLKIALERLARHYGLGDAATGPARTKTRHWGAEDYRPSL